MMYGHGSDIRHNITGGPAAPADHLIAVNKNSMGKAGKLYPGPGGKSPELKQKKPGQKLGLAAVGVPEGDNTAALAFQGPLKGGEHIVLTPEHCPGYAVKKEKIKPGEKPEEENNKQRNPRFRNFYIR
jgi:hypothetical protein